MPYCDEGANLSVSYKLNDCLTATWDGYLVNGLSGDGEGINFDRIREYVDNNRSPAIGTRMTVGSQALRFGGSIMGGRFADYGGEPPVDSTLTYTIVGANVVARYGDLLRVQFQSAQRRTDRVIELPKAEFDRENVADCYVEGELLVSRCHKISLLMRYDRQDRSALLPPGESSLDTGTFDVSRWTLGVNWTLPGGSLLMVNDEYWVLPGALPSTHVVGVRWAATF